MTTIGSGGNNPPPSGASTDNSNPTRKMFLAYFDNGNVSGNSGKVLPVDTSVTSVAFGLAEPSRFDPSKQGEMLVMGLCDGRILISLLPLPLRVLEDTANNIRVLVRSTTTITELNSVGADVSVTATGLPSSDSLSQSQLDGNNYNAATTGEEPNELIIPVVEHEDTAVPLHGLDLTKCRSLFIHDGAVGAVRVSPTGNWIITAGVDGCMFLLATSVRAKALENVLESMGGDNTVFLTDRPSLLNTKTRIELMEQFVADAELEKNRSIEEMKANLKKSEASITSKLQAEVNRRDELIVKGREEQTRLCRIMQEEIDGLKDSHTREMSEVEVSYEKRIAQV